jgi:hypothetical protein
MPLDTEMLATARQEVMNAPILPLTMVNNEFINIVSEIGRGVKAHTFKVMEQYGVAQVMTTRATNVPLIGDSMTENLVRVFPVKVGFEIDDDEIELYAANGMNPFTTNMVQSRDAIDQQLDLIGFYGNPGTTLKGIGNFPGITIIQLPNDGVNPVGSVASRQWSHKTPTQILRDLNLIGMGVNGQTAGTVNANRIVLGHQAIQYLTNTPYNVTTGQSILSVFLANQNAIAGGGIRSMQGHPSLDTLGTGGTRGRAIAYNATSRYNKFHIPQGGGFMDSGIERRGDLRKVECKAKTAGVEIQKIKEVVYADIEL